MRITELFNDDQAVSPVVGVALLIAITVILAAVIGGVVLGLGSTSADQPQASLQFEYNSTASPDELTISHTGGDALDNDEIEIRSTATGVDDTALGEDLAAGESTNIEAAADGDAEAGDEYSVVWMDSNSNEEAVIATFEVSDSDL